MTESRSLWLPPGIASDAVRGRAARLRVQLPAYRGLSARGGHSGMVRDKVRIRFRKAGDLRLVSHHDLMHCFERMLRRALLPFHSTEGFNPHPRLVFALSLALGVVGCEEVVDLELDAELPPDTIQSRLAQQAPPGLSILSVHRVARKASNQVKRVCYRVAVP